MDSAAELNRVMYRYLSDNVKLSRKKTTVAVNLVTDKIRKIAKYINKKDKRFQAEVQCTGSYYQGLKVKAADEFDFNVYLTGFESVNEWGGGAGPRHYRFNRDYNRDIYVQLEFQFIPPPAFVMAAAISSVLTQQRYVSDPTIRGLPVPQHSAAAPPALWEQRSNQPSPKPAPQKRFQGPALPLGPPIDMDNLETLPDDLELLHSAKSLSEPPEGYKFFDFIPGIPAWQDSTDLVYQGDIIPFYVQRKFKKLIQDALREIEGLRGEIRPARKVHGPALSLRIPTEDETNPEISVDLAVAIPTKLPIPHSSGWPRSGKHWPSSDKVKATRSAGINFVAKKPYYWLMSYANCEKELIKNIDKEGECRKSCHRIMKSIRENYWCKTTKPVISSYHLKNLLFWECEDHPNDSEWAQDQIWARFKGMTERLLRCIQERKLPHYFNPKMNLLQNKNIETLNLERDNIIAFMKDPAGKLSKQ